jgi:MFS family permease
VTLLAGVLVDRHRRRPILIGSNLGRALLIGLIPLLAAAHWLRMPSLYVLAFAVGVLTVFFDVAYLAYLPSLVDRGVLLEGNTKLQASASAAQVGGPGLGGLLVQLFGAPGALLVDAISYLVSVATLGGIRTSEPRPPAATAYAGVWQRLRHDVGEGLRFTFTNPLLRPMAGLAATYNLFEQAIITLFVLYAIRRLGLSAGLLGLFLSAGAAGALLGSVTAGAAGRRLGIGVAFLGGVVVECAAMLLIPAVHGSLGQVVPVLVAAFALNGFGLGRTNVYAVSLRQTSTPDQLLGRVNASYRFLSFGSIPLGALLGGFLGQALGLRPALTIAAIALLSTILWLLLSPIPRLRALPELPPTMRHGEG